jgi:hypothetical protein
MPDIPDDAPRSDDGQYWWDGSQWQLVDASQGQGAGQNTAEGASSAHPVLAKVGNPSELQGHFENAMAAAEGEAKELEA